MRRCEQNVLLGSVGNENFTAPAEAVLRTG
jgi:hypothetical protein